MPQHGKPLLEASSMGCLLNSDLAVITLLSLSFSVKVLVHNLSFKTQASTYTSSGIVGPRLYSPLIGRKSLHHFLFSETWVEDDLNLCYSTSTDQPVSIRIYCELNKNTKSQPSSLTLLIPIPAFLQYSQVTHSYLKFEKLLVDENGL